MRKGIGPKRSVCMCRLLYSDKIRQHVHDINKLYFYTVVARLVSINAQKIFPDWQTHSIKNSTINHNDDEAFATNN